MLLFQIVQMYDPAISPDRCKIHLASTNVVGERPLDVFFAGGFDAWQSRQSQKNFEREFVLSLIQTPLKDCWLFAGAHDALGCKDAIGHPWVDETTPWYSYDLQRRDRVEPLSGNVLVRFKRDGRNSYRNGENCEGQLLVSMYRDEPFQECDFGEPCENSSLAA